MCVEDQIFWAGKCEFTASLFLGWCEKVVEDQIIFGKIEESTQPKNVVTRS